MMVSKIRKYYLHENVHVEKNPVLELFESLYCINIVEGDLQYDCVELGAGIGKLTKKLRNRRQKYVRVI